MMHCVFMPNTQLCPALVAQYPFVVKSLYSLEDSPHVHGRYPAPSPEGKSRPRQSCAFSCLPETSAVFPAQTQLPLAWFRCAMLEGFFLITCVEKCEDFFLIILITFLTFLRLVSNIHTWAVGWRNLRSIFRDSSLTWETDFIHLLGCLAGWVVACFCSSKP